MGSLTTSVFVIALLFYCRINVFEAAEYQDSPAPTPSGQESPSQGGSPDIHFHHHRRHHHRRHGHIPQSQSSLNDIEASKIQDSPAPTPSGQESPSQGDSRDIHIHFHHHHHHEHGRHGKSPPSQSSLNDIEASKIQDSPAPTPSGQESPSQEDSRDIHIHFHHHHHHEHGRHGKSPPSQSSLNDIEASKIQDSPAPTPSGQESPSQGDSPTSMS
ncbi:IQ motif and SEC7 domain-containing protein 2-like [Cucurbita moschata]|uniref:IQ motif and SEC7 domain-containing protein 2-like n=1 Tax=Cucurbita moschata TaxID=3662 RepID=A0A6J1EUK9_CUCMO|nr:IQ motif and SEC7 domain-containing protein 2-like [Cucurbita moschata]